MSRISAVGRTGDDIVIGPSGADCGRHDLPVLRAFDDPTFKDFLNAFQRISGELTYRCHGFESTKIRDIILALNAALAARLFQTHIESLGSVFEIVLYPGKIDAGGTEFDSLVVSHGQKEFPANFLILADLTSGLVDVVKRLFLFSKFPDEAKIKNLETRIRHFKELLAEIQNAKITRDAVPGTFTKKMFKFAGEVAVAAGDVLALVENENQYFFNKTAHDPSPKAAAIVADTTRKLKDLASDLKRFASLVDAQQWSFREGRQPVFEIHLNVIETLSAVFEPRPATEDVWLRVISPLVFSLKEPTEDLSILKQQFDRKSGRDSIWTGDLKDATFPQFFQYLTGYYFKDYSLMFSSDPIWHQQMARVFGTAFAPLNFNEKDPARLSELISSIS